MIITSKAFESIEKVEFPEIQRYKQLKVKHFGTSRNNITFYLPSNVTELKKDGVKMQEKVLQLQFHQKIKDLQVIKKISL